MSAPDIERATRAPSPDAAPPGRRHALRPLMMRLHFYAGILVAPFILVAAISGGLYAIAPTLEQVVYRDYLHVETTGPARPVAEQIRAAEQVRPDLTVAAVRPAPETGDTTRVLFTDDPSLGESERLAVFVDPSTAQPIGELVVYGSSSALPMRTWISQLHRHLHLGEPGRIYSELAASWMWVIALGGLYLWWERHRKARARGASTRLLTVDRSARGRGRTLNWHGAVGVWIVVGLVFLSATGLTWSKYAGKNVGELRSALSWTTPTVDNALGSPTAGAAGGHEGHGGMAHTQTDGSIVDTNIGRVDSVLTVARENGVEGAVEASIPADDTTAFTVAETRQPWVFATDSIAVDGATDQVTDVLRFASWPLAAKLTSWGIQLHMGLQFGLLNQLALAALAVALVTVIVRGYILWWRRRPTRGSDWAVGRPPLRGALRQVHPAAAVAIVAAAAAVGWFVPLLGLSLLAFLAVDAVVRLTKRERA